VTGGLTRRALLRGGALGSAWLVAGRPVALAAPVAAPRAIARAVALGPGGSGVEQSYAANRNRFVDTATPWVRLWADWSQAQPVAALAPDLSSLDADVALAKADGLRVMITAWRVAPWAAAPGSGDPTFRVPVDLSPAGAWARWIELLVTRYAGRIDALEIVNEPNFQLAPQEGIDTAVATMMETASAIAARHPGAPLLVGPATADVDGYEDFTRAVLARLDERGFRPGPGFAWSHHNYKDVEEERTGAENGVARVRAVLRERWSGYSGLLITESGARVDKAGGLLQQADLIERNARRMLLGPEGEGVEMLCQYLFVTDANYDSGLCDVYGVPRPAYYAWSRLPSGRH
jgi:hypothetical protein